MYYDGEIMGMAVREASIKEKKIENRFKVTGILPFYENISGNSGFLSAEPTLQVIQ
jgi:hypothetical protein